MKTRKAVNYSYALYLDQFRIPTSPDDMPDGPWESIFNKDRREVAKAHARPEVGILKQVGENKDGNPIYVLTEEGDRAIAKYLKKGYINEVEKMDNDSKSEIKEIAIWFGNAVVTGVIGNRADAIFVELDQTAKVLSELIIKQYITMSR